MKNHQYVPFWVHPGFPKSSFWAVQEVEKGGPEEGTSKLNRKIDRQIVFFWEA